MEVRFDRGPRRFRFIGRGVFVGLERIHDLGWLQRLEFPLREEFADQVYFPVDCLEDRWIPIEGEFSGPVVGDRESLRPGCLYLGRGPSAARR